MNLAAHLIERLRCPDPFGHLKAKAHARDCLLTDSMSRVRQKRQKIAPQELHPNMPKRLCMLAALDQSGCR